MAKTLAVFTLVGLLLTLGLPVLAQEVQLPIENPEGLTSINLCQPTDSLQACIAKVFSIVFRFLIFVAGAFAVIMFVWAGILYISKGDDPGEAGKAKGKIVAAAIGLIIALIAYVAIQIIDRFVRSGTVS